MIKNQAILEIKKGDRTYQLYLSHESPLGEVFDVLCEMRGYIINRLNEVSKAEDKTDEAPKE